MTQDIKTLPFIEAVHLRYGMYAGTEPILHCVKEIISNALDEAKLGYGNVISITLAENTLTVQDHGRGIPQDKMYDVLCTPHTGGKFDTTGTAGLNGIGVKLCTALGHTRLISHGGNKQHILEVSKDSYVGAKVVSTTAQVKSGTTFIWTPSVDERFDTVIHADDIHQLVADYSFCNNVTFELNINGKASTVKPQPLKKLMPTQNLFSTVFSTSATIDNTTVEIVMAWAEDSADSSFINGVKLGDGGSHITYIRTALTRAFSTLISGAKGEDVRRGLNLAVKIDTDEELIFSSQAKEKIAMPSINTVVGQAMKQIVAEFDNKSLKLVLARLNKLNKALLTAQTVKEIKDKKIKASKFDESVVREELIIAEGGSAAGGIALNKDHNTQATYALRGKILNTWGKSLDEIKKNEEIQDLVKLLDEGYDKIILAVDSDVDGVQIAMLLLCFIHNFFPSYLEKGQVYTINLPRVSAKYNGKQVFLDELTADRKYTEVEYLKGLGSIEIQALGQFITNKKTRSLNCISYQNISPEELEIAFDKTLAHVRQDLLLEDYDQRFDKN